MKKKPSERIIELAKELRSSDWVNWAGNRYSKEQWDLMNPLDIKETDYLMLGLFKFLDEELFGRDYDNCGENFSDERYVKMLEKKFEKSILMEMPKLSRMVSDLLTADKIDKKHIEIIESEIIVLLERFIKGDLKGSLV